MSRIHDPYELILGTSQKDRLLPPLNPHSEVWPKIDGRSEADLKAFAKEFSRLIQFYDIANTPDGTWEPFFDDRQDESNPHYALFLAFLKAYGHAQDQINTITQRHLEFFYKELLHFMQRPAIPDKVHVIFELAKNQWLHRIEKGTLLNAGRDDQGNRLLYETDDEIIVNRAKIESVKTLYVDNYQRFYVRQEARKEPTKDPDGNTVYESWPLFGDKLQDKSIWTNPDLDYELGFAIASPILDCAEGDRTITLDMVSDDLFIGLAAYYPFTGNAHDESGNGNHGKVIKAELTDDRLEHPDSAYRFNSIEEYIEVASSPTLDIDRKITVSHWFKTGPSTDQSITVCKGIGPNPFFPWITYYSWFLYIDPPKKIGFKLKTVNNSIIDLAFENTEYLADDTWHHVAGTFDGETIAIYLDGVLGGASHLDTPDTISGPNWPLLIGRSGAYFFNGSLDDLKIYNRALTAAQIEELYNRYLHQTIDNPKLDINDNSLLVYFSGEKEWIGPFETESDHTTEKRLRIVTHIPADYPPVTAYSTKLEGIKLDTPYPVMKVLLNPRAYKFAYNPLKTFKIRFSNITVEVGMTKYSQSVSNLKGIETLDLSNDSGKLDPGSTFMPFGPAPEYGANFFIGCAEAFRKKIEELHIKWTWMDLPNLEEHYKNYADVSELAVIKADEFTAMSSVIGLKKGRKVDLGRQENWRIFVAPEISIYDTSRGEAGYVKLMLTGPFSRDYRFSCLGHREYANIYTERVMHNSKVGLNDPQDIVALPEKPWVPKTKEVSLSYIAKSNLLLEDHHRVQFIHITPFGFNNRSLWKDNGQYLLPQFRGHLGPFEMPIERVTNGNNDEDKPYGYLFIGLKNLIPPQKVHLLFQMAQGTGSDDIQTDLKDINWFYLKDNDWIPFSDSKYGPDDTFGMNASGIIGLTFTEESKDKNTILPENLHWICASNIKDPKGVSRSINVHTQAVSATYFAQDENKKEYDTPLNPDRIRKLIVKHSAVKKLEQPYSSFGGNTAEIAPSFYQRVSERLRHRNRGVDRWDYEHLILQKFRDIYKVKCLNKTNFLTKEEAGVVSLIVVPDLRRVKVLDMLEPRLHKGILEQAETFLQSKISCFISFAVQNSVYEQIRVHAKVRYHNQYDPGQYTAELNRQLIEYLAPWAFDTGVELVFGGVIYKSEILDFIEERYFVDKVADFWIEQITHGYGETGIGYMEIRDSSDSSYHDEDTFIVGYEVNIARATTPRSVLTSVKAHDLTIF